jgi:hypothetical protein
LTKAASTYTIDLVAKLLKLCVVVSVTASLGGASYKKSHLRNGHYEDCRSVLTGSVGLGVNKDDQTVVRVAKSGNIDILSLVVPNVIIRCSVSNL